MEKHGISMTEAGKYYPGGEKPKRKIGQGSSANETVEGDSREAKIARLEDYIHEMEARHKSGLTLTRQELAAIRAAEDELHNLGIELSASLN